mmetsp:Transcript_73286/g.174628  ORF Transcript_73286/g.174628 Transcript_73286/m.174628 type:complete len:90 (+) Transcript_73286:107-376(+)
MGALFFTHHWVSMPFCAESSTTAWLFGFCLIRPQHHVDQEWLDLRITFKYRTSTGAAAKGHLLIHPIRQGREAPPSLQELRFVHVMRRL